ncbi:uncharacterized protein KY384_008063 [Bacidia gigantensis]|uniref:uncharacterized protein n=1 Tax=Bacidia gigantensis TaxID=2732470 RepID=UPI001D05A041|nr:uncharacterized protein KY384_008063 [Bacidia gigantensis]KAG8526634.1 hypothetical protein KY384_008063 [Bacidia gigantensis]
MSVLVLTILTGLIFPFVVFGLGKVIFPHQADGSLIEQNGAVVGSELIGQNFAAAGYFHPRPSAAGGGYDSTVSGGTNLGPTSDKLLNGIHKKLADGKTDDPDNFDGVKDLAAAYRKDNGLADTAPVPADAVTRSASGLDPEISPENANLQVGRVARARNMDESAIRAVVGENTAGRTLGLLGEPRVNVLKLNMALDKMKALPAPPTPATPAPSTSISQFIWLLLIAFFVALIVRRFKIPYALALVVTGLLIGFRHLLPQAHLEPSALFTVFLPPLLFESAINLRLGALHQDWKPIAIYTLAGTVASTFIVGCLTAWMLHIPLAAGLVFGALISTTDPISVIAIFKRLGAGRRLTLIMEAESLFNNDTAVVLFTVMLAAVAGGSISIGSGVGQFLQLMVGGALLGTSIGVIASRVHFELDDHLIEITLTTLVAFGSYLIAETIHVSGVMAVVTAGIAIGNYGMPSAMSPGTRLAVVAFWEYLAFVVNSIVFLLVGVEVAYVGWKHHIAFTVGAIGFVLLGRAAIYPLSLLVNRVGGSVPRAWQHVLFWGGLRGALSMALALGLSRDFPARDALVAGTFGVVLFSLLAQGTTVGPLMKRLGLCGPERHELKDQRVLAGEMVAVQAALAELERLRSHEAHPNWSVELLTQSYRARVVALEKALADLQPDHKTLQQEQANRAHRQALMAEKNALLEAERQGWMEADDWRDLGARIDAELLALRLSEEAR